MQSKINGCDLCGDFPVELRARCHPTAPLRIEIDKLNIMSIYCYIPECNKLVTKLKVEQLNDQ